MCIAVESVRQGSLPDRSSSAATSPEPSDYSVMPEPLGLEAEERILVESLFLLQDYRQQKKEGKNPVFSKDKMPEIADQLEAW